jgi:hypothetical protein
MPKSSTNSTRWPSWLNAAAVLLASVVAIAALSLQARPGADIVAIVFPPWWTEREALLATAAARADIVRTTALPAVVVVRPHGVEGLARLRAAGGWFAIDPQAVAACL